MRKHVSISAVATLFLALIACLPVRAQVPALNGYSAAVLNYNPLGYWPLTETVAPPSTPPVAVNQGSLGASGNGQYLGGAYPGQPGALPGSTDTSVAFERATGEVVVPYSSGLTQSGALGVAGSFTAEAWFNAAFSNSTTEYILGYGNFGNTAANPTAGYSGFQLFLTSARLNLKLYDTNSTTSSFSIETSATASLTFLPGVWYDVAVVFSNNPTAHATNVFIFTNGVQCTSNLLTTANNVGLNFVSDDASGSPGSYIGTTFTVGCEPNEENFFQGNIGEVALYPSALTGTTLLSHYQNGTNTAPTQTYASLVNASSPLVYLPLNEHGAGYTYPVATNYASTGVGLGSAGNGYYMQGTSPGGATGPTVLGSPPVVNFPPSTQRSSYGLPETGRALTLGANVEMAPLNDLLLNINTNFVAGTANTNTTVLAWVQCPVSVPSSGVTGVPWFTRIMGRNDGSSYRLAENPSFFPNTNNLPGYPDFTDGSLDNVGSFQVNDGLWHFWAATFNQTNILESLYIDGVLTASATSQGLPSYANTSPLTIGSGANVTTDDGGNFAYGNVCGVAVYNTALSAAQIDAIYGAAFGGIITQPPATAPFTGGALTLSAIAAAPSMQWFTGAPGSGTPVVNSATISGATTESLTLNPPAVFGNYYLEIYTGPNGTGTPTDSSVVAVSQISVTGSFVAAVQALHPVGFWPLNESSGTIAFNYGSLGSVANGTYVTDPNGSSTFTQVGVPGPNYANLPSTKALEFGTTKGTDILGGAGVYIMNQPGLMLGGSNSIQQVPRPVTVAEWIQVPTGTVGWFQSITGKGDNSFRTDEEQPQGGFNADAGSDLKTASGINDGKWHYLIGTYDGIGTQNIYVDGLPAGQNSTGPNTGGQSHQFFLGGAPDYVGRNFVGNLTDVAVFNYALSSSQALQLWNTMYSPSITLPASVFYVSNTASTTITASAQGPYQQWYFGTPGSGTPVFNNSSISGAGAGPTLGQALPILTFTASGNPASLPAGDYGTYYLVVGDNQGNFVTSSIVTLSQIGVTGVFDQAVLNLKPIAYYPLNETAGNTVYNYATTGSGLNGILENFANCPNVQGVPGPALYGFGGVNAATAFSVQSGSTSNSILGYVGTMNVAGGEAGTGVLINSTVLDVASNVTIAAWVQLPAGFSVANQEYIYGQSADHTLIDFGTGGGIPDQLDLGCGGGALVTAGPNLADGNWHFVVATYNATNFAGVDYIDGVLNASNIYSAPVVTTSPTGIGCSTADTRNFNGQICRLAVFTNVLSAVQVNTLFNDGGLAPYFISQPPAMLDANAGGTLTIGNVVSGGSTPITNTWYFGAPGSGTPITTGGRFTATSSNLVINPVQASDAGSYYVAAANQFATADSTATVLSVNTTVNDTIFSGQSPSFSLTGPGPFSWTFSGTAASTSGATTGTFTLNSVTGSGTVTGSINGVSAATYVLTVQAAPTDPYPAAVLGDHPIGYFRLDETAAGTDIAAGTEAHDYVGGNNGIYVNDNVNGSSPATSQDLAGVAGFPYGTALAANTDTAVSFGALGSGGVDNTPASPINNFAGFISGLDFATSVSNSISQPGNGEFSIEAWVYAGEGQHNGGIVTKGYGFGDGNTAPGFFEQFSLQISDGGTTGSAYDFCVHDALGNLASATTKSFYTGYQNPPGLIFNTDGAFWQHLVGVCDQTNGHVLLYVNGLLAATGSIAKGNGIMSTPVPMSIGAKQQENTSGNYDGQLNGSVDEVAIYNYALSSNQVLSHYLAAGIAPVILTDITNHIGTTTNAPQNSTVHLSVVAYGSPTLTYQWYDYNFGSPIKWNGTGSTTPSLTLSGVTSANIGSGTFEVIVSNPDGTATSSQVTVNVFSGPPQILTDLSFITYTLAGQNTVLSVNVTGTSPYTFDWFVNGSTTPLTDGGRISGSSTAALTIANTQVSDAASYQVVIHNSQGQTPSTQTTLVVDNELNFFGNGNGWTLTAGAGDLTLPTINGGTLTITQNEGNDVNGFFYNSPVYAGAFQASFVYTDITTAGADGFAFVLQNDPRGVAALGGGGGQHGYGNNGPADAGTGITNSVAVNFNIYAGGAGFAAGNGIAMAFQGLADGGDPQAGGFGSVTPVSIRSGDSIMVALVYNGNTMSVGLTDLNNGTVYNTNYVIGSVVNYLGTNTALVGFTGATGGVTAQQTISSFTYVPLPMLTVAQSGSSVVLTWPTGIGGYVLVSSSTVNGTYVPVAGSPTVVNGNNQVTVPATQAAAFYQLKVTAP